MPKDSWSPPSLLRLNKGQGSGPNQERDPQADGG